MPESKHRLVAAGCRRYRGYDFLARPNAKHHSRTERKLGEAGQRFD